MLIFQGNSLAITSHAWTYASVAEMTDPPPLALGLTLMWGQNFMPHLSGFDHLHSLVVSRYILMLCAYLLSIWDLVHLANTFLANLS